MPEWKLQILYRLAPLKLDPTREAEIVAELSQHLEDAIRNFLPAASRKTPHSALHSTN
jgi:hypothetical protein